MFDSFVGLNGVPVYSVDQSHIQIRVKIIHVKAVNVYIFRISMHALQWNQTRGIYWLEGKSFALNTKQNKFSVCALVVCSFFLILLPIDIPREYSYHTNLINRVKSQKPYPHAFQRFNNIVLLGLPDGSPCGRFEQ